MRFQNIIKTDQDYSSLKKAAHLSTSILKDLVSNVKEDVSAGDINDLAEELLSKNKAKAAFKGVTQYTSPMPYPYSVCVSVNDEILHGMPHKTKYFKTGDIVKVDFGLIYEGFYTDHCVTVGLGNITEREKTLLSTGKLCIDSAAEKAVVGNTIEDISETMQTIAEISRFDYVKTYCGHGIGKSLWLQPEVPSYVSSHRESISLIEGMVLCVENQITIGKADLILSDDGWTLKTKDKSKGAMFEHMVIVRKDKAEILTKLD